MTEQNGSGGQGRQSKHTEEFKRSVVEHWVSSCKPAHQVAREFGVKRKRKCQFLSFVLA